MHTTLLCLLALTELFPSNASPSYSEKVGKTYLDKLGVCVQVSNKAESMGVLPSLAVSIAYEESGFNENVKSSAGAIGPMQVLPRYGCPNGVKGCDLIEAGLRILKNWQKRFKKPKDFLCHYNAGNRCTKASRGYARRVLWRQKRLQVQMKNASWDFEQY